MTQFGNQPYELPTNTDLEAVLSKNLDHINPVEMREKEVSGKKTLFPFWVPVKDAEGISFTDYKKYLSGKEKALDIKAQKDKVGIVQPKKENKSYEEDNIIDRIEGIINKHNKTSLSDNTGAVKVVKNDLKDTKTNKQVIDNKVGEIKSEVEKSAKAPASKVGVVKPKSEGMPAGTKSQIIDNKVGKPTEAKVDKSAKSKTGVGAVQTKSDMGKQTKFDITAGSKKSTGENVGVVKPKSVNMDTKTSKQVTVNKVDKAVEPKVEKAGKPSGDKVGSVKPKSDMVKQNVSINFDKFKTDHIKGAKLEGVEGDVITAAQRNAQFKPGDTKKDAAGDIKVGKDVMSAEDRRKEVDDKKKKFPLKEGVEKFNSFVEGFKGQGEDGLIETIQKAFKRCFGSV